MTDAQREKQWRAESDARALKEAGLITGDKQRYKEAQAVLAKEQKAISNVMKSTAPSTAKSTNNTKRKAPPKKK